MLPSFNPDDAFHPHKKNVSYYDAVYSSRNRLYCLEPLCEELPHVPPDPPPDSDPHPHSEPIRESPSEHPPLPRNAPFSIPKPDKAIVPPDPPLDE